MNNMSTRILPANVEINIDNLRNTLGLSTWSSIYLLYNAQDIQRWIDHEVASDRSTEERRQEWEDLSYYAGLMGLGEHSNFRDLVQCYADRRGFSIQHCGAEPDVAWIVAANAAVCAMKAIEEMKINLFSHGEPDITEDLGNRG